MATGFTRLLGFRLFFLLLLIGAVVFISLTVFITRATSSYIMDGIVDDAKRTNDLIENSIHYSMLKNRKEDVAEIIKTIGRGPGVEGIRIYNKKGVIVFSTADGELGQSVDVNAEQCTVCHAGGRPLDYVPDATRPRVFQSPNGYRVLAVVNPIRNEAACAKPECHPSPSEQKILGVLDAKMSLAQADANIKSARKSMILYSIVAVGLIEVFAGMFIWRMVHLRVRRLNEGTKNVIDGNLDFKLDVAGDDEISSFAKSFNRMVGDLKSAHEKNDEWSRTLEEKVETKTKELRQAQEQMIQVAKMASMGKLAATVAHEINNPLGGILTYVKLLNKQLAMGPLSDEQRKTGAEQLNIVVGELKRCGNIVKNMLHFSKSPDSAFEKVNVHEIIEKSLFIINHHLEMNQIKIVKETEAKDPVVTANANQIQQALIALYINAVEAMTNGGVLKIKTLDLPDRDALGIWISDNGKGVPPENLADIFEPFFTTKEEASGVGLGLSVVYGIIQGHQGKIEVKSSVGEGTSFIIKLPRTRKPDETN